MSEPPIEVPPAADPPRRRRYGAVGFAVLFVIALAVFLYTIAPVLAPILLGCLLAAFASPLVRRVEKRLSGRRGLAAAFVTVGLFIGVVAPLMLLAIAIGQRALRVAARAPELVQWIEAPDGLGGLLERHPWLRRIVPADLGAQGTAAVGWVANELPGLLDGLLDQALGLFLTLLTAYYVMKDGRWMLERLVRALPIEPRYTRALAAEFRDVGRSIVVGTLGTALLQGTVAGLCFWALDLSEPLLLGAVTAVLSVVPAVGSGLVWVPLAAYLLATGQIGKAAVLVVLGILVIGLVDNVVRPLLNRGRLDVHPLLVFLGIFGGLAAFGVSGLYLGPLFVSLFVAVSRIYERDLSPAVTRDSSRPTGATPASPPGGRRFAVAFKNPFAAKR